MSVIDDYLASLGEPEKPLVAHLYSLLRSNVPEATEELSYAMPSFKYRGKGLVAIMKTKQGLSLYPFCSVARLGIDLSGYECTSGSIHFRVEQPVSDELFMQIVLARKRQIEAKQ